MATSPVRRISFFAFGLFCYGVFFATILYAIGFVGNFLVPVTIDGEPTKSLPIALAINCGLLALFAVQHSVMARPAFKRAWTRIVPKELERSIYVLLSSACLLLLFAFWEPLGGLIWELENGTARIALWTVFALGWSLVFLATFLIDHFDLFGLRQVWFALRDKPYEPVRFVEPALYRVVRHPLYLGMVLAFWSTPRMTAAHLVFAVMTTAYILVGIQFEERDLVSEHGESYLRYRERVPMLIPGTKRARPATASKTHKVGETV